jgi:hypothetical protein
MKLIMAIAQFKCRPLKTTCSQMPLIAQNRDVLPSQLSQLSAEINTKAVGLFQSAAPKIPDSGHPHLNCHYVFKTHTSPGPTRPPNRVRLIQKKGY